MKLEPLPVLLRLLRRPLRPALHTSLLSCGGLVHIEVLRTWARLVRIATHVPVGRVHATHCGVTHGTTVHRPTALRVVHLRGCV